MKSLALIGSNGFVGQSIKKYLIKNKQIVSTFVTRDNYEEARLQKKYDVIINSAMPSKRFWATQNPHQDFNETVQKTFRIMNDWESSKVIQISSISARSQPNTIYGRNKAAAEKLVENENNLILRLGPMYGDTLNKGVLIDLLKHDPVYISEESLYCFAPVDWVGEWIASNIHITGILDLGGNNAISVGKVAKSIGSNSIFKGPTDNQIVSKEIKFAPKAENVIKYILNYKKNNHI